MKYRVTKGKTYEDGKEIPVGHVFDVEDGDEVPAFLVDKVEQVPEELTKELTEKPAVDKPVDKPAVDKK